MFQSIPPYIRPPYFHDLNYEPFLPEFNYKFSNINILSEYTPNINMFLFDKIEYTAGQEVRHSSNKNEITALLKQIREYYNTIKNSDPYLTVVTHMYICELLIKVLLKFFKEDNLPPAHGYSTQNWNNVREISQLALSLQDSGIAQALHELFYFKKFPKKDSAESPKPELP